MTKAQEFTFDLIEKHIAENKAFTWGNISDAVKSDGLVVKNWMTIRSVLQVFLNERSIQRTDDVSVEEYRILWGQ